LLTRAPTETRERFSLSAIYDGLLEKSALPASGPCGGPRDQEAGYSFPPTLQVSSGRKISVVFP